VILFLLSHLKIPICFCHSLGSPLQCNALLGTTMPPKKKLSQAEKDAIKAEEERLEAEKLAAEVKVNIID
jgi:hypothetical protein